MTAMKKNALIIAYNDLNNSGVPNVIYQTIKALHSEYNFDVVVFGNDLFYYQKLIDEGITNVTIINWHKESKRNKLSRIINYLVKEPKEIFRKTKKLLKEKQYSVLHSFKEYESWPFLKAAKDCGLQKRIVHTTVIHGENESFLVKRNKRKTLSLATDFVGVTIDACKKAWPGAKHKVIHFSYDESKYNSNKCSLKSDELVLTHVGTYSTNKNQLFSIEVLKELKLMYPKAKLQIIGAEREKGYFSKMKQYIDANGLDDWIKIIDGSLGAEKYTPSTSFYLLPSYHEGASLVVVEGQACGIKVFASYGVPQEMNVGGITYLDLNDGPKKWAEVIYEEFKKSGNARTAYDTTSFSSENFKKNISNLYLK